MRALRRTGHIVAVTGDGANDAPAIRLADAGIAAGEQSTAAARRAAGIVVTDERIETPRRRQPGEIIFTAGSSLASARSPLNPRQLSLVNRLTDLVPALAVAARPPRSVTAEMILQEEPDTAVGDALTQGVLRRAFATAAVTPSGWLAARRTGAGPARSSTVALTCLVGAQLAQTASAARRDP